ncbi:hypothetical protein [Pedobacter mendelii]|uniref:Uncharacterized protein n=1 Tax=Pedobacter mendelii TaxID=1908240 RepID=A0ABQ2BDA6_9SPHI|nr:hypothetical protein [Pedobacter mendelii]GGI23259.1 hypothetical protein GCM10008119_06770 [Pedobacter mendelii]
MPEDYQDVVLAAYKQKQKEEGMGLPLKLLRPTTAKLKKACLRKYDASEEAKDIFSEFFDKDRIETDFSLIISKADDGCFRPLLNHLNGTTTKTDEKNTELLAWLIDFQPRPSISYYKNLEKKAKEEDEQLVDDIEKTTSTEPEGFSDQEKEKIGKQPDTDGEKEKPAGIKIWKNQNIRKAVYAFIAAFAAVGGSYFTWKLVDKQCMYWTGDEYQPVTCDTKLPEAAVVALDDNKVDHLKRITKRDTLTSYSIGKVFYGKINSKIEFYTDSGDNPVNNEKRLLPMTSYIFDKYILPLKR